MSQPTDPPTPRGRSHRLVVVLAFCGAVSLLVGIGVMLVAAPASSTVRVTYEVGVGEGTGRVLVGERGTVGDSEWVEFSGTHSGSVEVPRGATVDLTVKDAGAGGTTSCSLRASGAVLDTATSQGTGFSSCQGRTT